MVETSSGSYCFAGNTSAVLVENKIASYGVNSVIKRCRGIASLRLGLKRCQGFLAEALGLVTQPRHLAGLE